MKNNSFK